MHPANFSHVHPAHVPFQVVQRDHFFDPNSQGFTDEYGQEWYQEPYPYDGIEEAFEEVGYGGDEVTGFDFGPFQSYSDQAVEYGRGLGQKIARAVPNILSPISGAGQRIGEGLGQGIKRGLTSSMPDFGDIQSKASAAADKTSSAAEALRHAAENAESTSNAIKDTAHIAKIVLIGLGVLGSIAIVYSMTSSK